MMIIIVFIETVRTTESSPWSTFGAEWVEGVQSVLFLQQRESIKQSWRNSAQFRFLDAHLHLIMCNMAAASKRSNLILFSLEIKLKQTLSCCQKYNHWKSAPSLSLSLFLCLSVSVSVCLSRCLSVCLSGLSICPSDLWRVLCAHVFVCACVWVRTCVSACAHMRVYRNVCACTCLCASLCVCVFVYEGTSVCCSFSYFFVRLGRKFISSFMLSYFFCLSGLFYPKRKTTPNISCTGCVSVNPGCNLWFSTSISPLQRTRSPSGLG